MDHIEFLNVARSFLQKENIKEIDYRNAISRAYYCAFHACKLLLEKYPPTKQQHGAEHEKIISGLLKHQNKNFRPIGNRLKYSKEQRVRANYNLAMVLTIHDAKQVIKSVEKIVHETEEYFNST